MSAYATKQDMIDRFGAEELIAITDRANPPTGAVDDDVLVKALEAATAEVNSNAMITDQVVTITDQLVTMTCQIARYHLSDPCSERVRKDYEDAIGFLRRVGAGTAVLAGLAGETPQASSDAPRIVSNPRLFTRDSLKDF